MKKEMKKRKEIKWKEKEREKRKKEREEEQEEAAFIWSDFNDKREKRKWKEVKPSLFISFRRLVHDFNAAYSE